MALKTALDRDAATGPKPPGFCPLGDLRVQRSVPFAALPDPPHARWERLAAPPGLAVATVMPTLRLAPAAQSRPYGRPTIAMVNPERLEATAVLVDLGGWRRCDVASRLHSVGLHARPSELKMVQHDPQRARKMLAERGCLPRAAWPAGKLPHLVEHAGI